MRITERAMLLAAIRSLMVAENGGDMHEVLNQLCDLAGLPRPQGDYLDGWADEDYLRVGLPVTEDEDDQ